MAAQIRRIAIDDITPHPSNPKAHDLGTLIDSIVRFGFVEPIVVDQRTGLNISGHGRVEALTIMRQRGDDPPAGITVDDARWLAPVFVGWSSTDDIEAEAALVALNRIGEAGGWEDEPLVELLTRLAEVDRFDGVGYDEGDLEDLRALLEHQPDLDAIANEYDPDAVNLTTIRIAADPALHARWTGYAADFPEPAAALAELLPDA